MQIFTSHCSFHPQIYISEMKKGSEQVCYWFVLITSTRWNYHCYQGGTVVRKVIDWSIFSCCVTLALSQRELTWIQKPLWPFRGVSYRSLWPLALLDFHNKLRISSFLLHSLPVGPCCSLALSQEQLQWKKSVKRPGAIYSWSNKSCSWESYSPLTCCFAT